MYTCFNLRIETGILASTKSAVFKRDRPVSPEKTSVKHNPVHPVSSEQASVGGGMRISISSYQNGEQKE